MNGIATVVDSPVLLTNGASTATIVNSVDGFAGYTSGNALGLLVLSLFAIFALWWVEDVLRLRKVNRLLSTIKGENPSGRQRVKAPKKDGDLGVIAIEVAARLRSGASPNSAWQNTWKRIIGTDAGALDDQGVPKALLAIERAASKQNWMLRTVSPTGWVGSIPWSRVKRAELWQTARILVMACRFSALTGAPIAAVLEQASKNLVISRHAQSEQKVAFAGPKISVKILAALPLLGIFLASAIGANPLSWYLSSTVGLVVGFLGLALFTSGVLLCQNWVVSAERETTKWVFAPNLCDLATAGLKSGLSIPSVLNALGIATNDEHLQQISAELVLGATWAEAWSQAPADTKLLRIALQPAWEDGISPTGLLSFLSAQTRENQNLEARQAAAKLGVKLAIPLAGLLLPAFVLLSIVPIIATLAPSLGI